MKRFLAYCIAVLFLISSNSLIASASEGLDVSILENSNYYSYNNYTNTWKVQGWSITGDDSSGKYFEVFLSLDSKNVESGDGPFFQVSHFYEGSKIITDVINSFKIIIDETIYSFENPTPVEGECSCYIYGGEVFHSFLTSLSSAKEVIFQLERTTEWGSTRTIYEIIKTDELLDLIRIAQLFEQANLWDQNVTTNLTSNDDFYKASIIETENLAEAEPTIKGKEEKSHEHEWQDATYAMPKHCVLCGKTEGERLKLSGRELVNKLNDQGYKSTTVNDAWGEHLAIILKDSGDSLLLALENNRKWGASTNPKVIDVDEWVVFDGNRVNYKDKGSTITGVDKKKEMLDFVICIADILGDSLSADDFAVDQTSFSHNYVAETDGVEYQVDGLSFKVILKD